MPQTDQEQIINAFKSIVPPVDYWSIRLVETEYENICVRQDILQPPNTAFSTGVFITVTNKNGIGYAATSNVTKSGLKQAAMQAKNWAEISATYALINVNEFPKIDYSGQYRTPVAKSWNTTSFSDKIMFLQDACKSLKISEKIVDWHSFLSSKQCNTLLVTSANGCIEQSFQYITPGLVAVANSGPQTQIRTGGGSGSAAQGGLEQLDRLGFPDSAQQIAEEALLLLDAPECPTGSMDLLLMPDQMVLQIHESIGHPLELDRILGDERNYAGTSFVTLDMFGDYRYGSELLNITFDPTHPEQLASYGFDDDGTPAKHTYIIQKGLLEKPLGGLFSQARTKMDGVANSRACDWNRPPIDRMANLNLEPGNSSMQEMISSIENGILMDTNQSWSIDDSRNKFQFGCELGKIIKQGEIKDIVKNPNYRGISANFWQNLIKVGNKSTFEISGTPNCGKGEPNQVIHVGHASPACVFKNVEVFGGSA